MSENKPEVIKKELTMKEQLESGVLSKEIKKSLMQNDATYWAWYEKHKRQINVVKESGRKFFGGSVCPV